MSPRDARAVPKTVTVEDGRSAGTDVAWEWIIDLERVGWVVDVIRVADPEPSVEALFKHEPLHEKGPEALCVTPDGRGVARVRHFATAHDPRITLNEERDGQLSVMGARGCALLQSMRIRGTAECLMRCDGTPLLVSRSTMRICHLLRSLPVLECPCASFVA